MTGKRPAGTDRPPEVPLNASRGLLHRLVRDQRVLFLLVGACNTAFSTLLFIGLVLLFGPGVPSAISLFIAWVISLTIVFFVYRRFVFRVSGNVGRDFLRFVGVNLGSLMLNVVILTILSDIVGLHPIPTQLSIVTVVVLFNYFGHKHFSFRR